ncbi:DUF6262 family protein [Streptomyces canus]|uniref:DUF6262 family protein n=1 Tax=Streptomyces canus TaxID=58343 RepID=UPI003421940E|nr:DUF6262 family protein [Streptomyces canus]
MRADNSRHIVAAAGNRHVYTRAKAIKALREIDAAGTVVTFDIVARAASVSRSWLYTQPDLRGEIERLRAHRQRASDASLIRRLEAANERNRRLTEENRQLREQLAHAPGNLRAARLQSPPIPEARRQGRGSATIGPC